MNGWLVLSHLVAFAAGAVMWNFIVRREVDEMAGDDEQDKPEEPDKPKATHTPYMSRSAIIGLVVGVWLATLGVQQFFYQDTQSHLNNCLTNWATDITTTFQTRSDATTTLDAARTQRDDAVDKVITTVAEFSAKPPTATPEDFTEALAEFTAAKANLVEVQKDVSDTRDDNPYPVLKC